MAPLRKRVCHQELMMLSLLKTRAEGQSKHLRCLQRVVIRRIPSEEALEAGPIRERRNSKVQRPKWQSS